MFYNVDNIATTSSSSANSYYSQAKSHVLTTSQALLLIRVTKSDVPGSSRKYGNQVIYKHFKTLSAKCARDLKLQDFVKFFLRILHGIQYKYTCLNFIGLNDICVSCVEDKEVAAKNALVIDHIIHYKRGTNMEGLIADIVQKLKCYNDSFIRDINIQKSISGHLPPSTNVRRGNLILSNMVMNMAKHFKEARIDALVACKGNKKISEDKYQTTYYKWMVKSAVAIRSCKVPVQWLTLKGLAFFDIIGNTTNRTGPRILKAFELNGEVDWYQK